MRLQAAIVVAAFFCAQPAFSDDFSQKINLEKKLLEDELTNSIEKCKKMSGSQGDISKCVYVRKQQYEKAAAELKKNPQQYFNKKGKSEI
jgi:hypothetical protein